MGELPGVPLTNFNDGGGGRGFRERFIFNNQRNHNFIICLPIKINTFFSIPQKIPLFFSRTKKIPASFIDPKNHFWPKFQAQ